MIDVVPSETVRGRTPWSLAYTGVMLAAGMAVSLNLMRRLKPAAVVGFGGYPTLPPLWPRDYPACPASCTKPMRCSAAPTVFCQTASARSRRRCRACSIATPRCQENTTVGTPMRPAILAAAAVKFVSPTPTGQLRLLVVGGSQGARVMADIVPGAIERLEPALWNRLILTQQAREEDMARVRAVYDRLNINAELAPFFSDFAARLASSISWFHDPAPHRGRARRHRPPVDPGAAARFDRPGPVRQCRHPGAANGALRIPQADFTPTGWPRKYQRSPRNLSG